MGLLTKLSFNGNHQKTMVELKFSTTSLNVAKDVNVNGFNWLQHLLILVSVVLNSRKVWNINSALPLKTNLVSVDSRTLNKFVQLIHGLFQIQCLLPKLAKSLNRLCSSSGMNQLKITVLQLMVTILKCATTIILNGGKLTVHRSLNHQCVLVNGEFFTSMKVFLMNSVYAQSIKPAQVPTVHLLIQYVLKTQLMYQVHQAVKMLGYMVSIEDEITCEWMTIQMRDVEAEPEPEKEKIAAGLPGLGGSSKRRGSLKPVEEEIMSAEKEKEMQEKSRRKSRRMSKQEFEDLLLQMSGKKAKKKDEAP